jgi:plastocyanin
MMCEEWLEPLSAAADGELDERESAALADHLRGCPSCRLLAERFTDMRRRMLVGVPVAVPDLEPAVMLRRNQDLLAARTLRRRGLAALVGVAAAAAIVFGLVVPAARPDVPSIGTVAPSMRVVKADAATFSTPTVRVAAGSRVEWQNHSDTDHRLVRRISGTTLASDLGPGQTEVVTFDDPGVYSYYCSIHAGMTGRVLVNS